MKKKSKLKHSHRERSFHNYEKMFKTNLPKKDTNFFLLKIRYTYIRTLKVKTKAIERMQIKGIVQIQQQASEHDYI
jgi:hypothetical protein